MICVLRYHLLPLRRFGLETASVLMVFSGITDFDVPARNAGDAGVGGVEIGRTLPPLVHGLRCFQSGIRVPLASAVRRSVRALVDEVFGVARNIGVGGPGFQVARLEVDADGARGRHHLVLGPEAGVHERRVMLHRHCRCGDGSGL